ncbi:MAG: transposase, partial [Chloroflexi bacterium]|nr:transposase [Chloroflexota bacterium]
MKRKHNRRSIRLPEWDYRSEGYYFITICTFQRECLFADKRLHEIAAQAWDYIPQQPHAKHVITDESVIMPNHGHGILHVVSGPDTPLPELDYPHGPQPGSTGAIVGNYKMLVT